MRVVFPTNDDKGYLSQRGAHFGKALFYTVVTIENGVVKDVEVVKNPGHVEGGCSNAVTNILSLNPDALVVGGIGGRPAQGFMEAGLDLYFDQTSPTVIDSIHLFLKGKLKKSSGEGTCGVH